MQLGLERGDAACVVIGRIPEWYSVLFGCMKAGIISMPGTNLLTAKDIAYRVNQAGAKAVIVTLEHCEKVDALFAEAAIQADDTKRQELYTRAQNVIVDDVPVAWMLELKFPTIYRCNLKNPVSTAIGVNDGLRDAWLAKK